MPKNLRVRLRALGRFAPQHMGRRLTVIDVRTPADELTELATIGTAA